MSGQTTFAGLRELADVEGRRAMYDRGGELGHPCYGDGPRTLSTWTCPKCGETVQRDDSGGAAFKACGCLMRAYHDARLEYKSKHRPAVLLAEKERSGIPDLYMAATFENFKPRPGTGEALQICKDYAGSFEGDNPAGLILYGPSGSGKTHLAAAILHLIMDELDIAPRFVEAVQLLHEIRQRRDEDSDPVEQCKKAPLLVLDDLGNHQITPFAQDQLYAILSGRYTARRPTIITTNCEGPKLTEVFGPAFRSRIYQMCKAVPVSADDYRATGGGEEPV